MQSSCGATCCENSYGPCPTVSPPMFGRRKSPRAPASRHPDQSRRSMSVSFYGAATRSRVTLTGLRGRKLQEAVAAWKETL